jgi:hypothetical protein
LLGLLIIALSMQAMHGVRRPDSLKINAFVIEPLH